MLSSDVVTGACCLFFRSSSDVKAALPEIAHLGWNVLEMDGANWQSMEDVFKSFASVMRMPSGYYGPDETFAPNADVFLEYLDDAAEWHPAEGHLYVLHHAVELLSKSPETAGYLAELIQISRLERDSDAKLVFVVEGMESA